MELSKDRKGLEKRFYDLSLEVVQGEGYLLYDLDYVSSLSTLKVFIFDEKTGSAVIEDCVKVDKAFTEHIDQSDWMPSSLTLEVSSPGVFRRLKTREHFERVVGKYVDFTLNKNIDDENELLKAVKKNKKLRFRVVEVQEEDLIVEYQDKKFEIKFQNIKKAYLGPEING